MSKILLVDDDEDMLALTGRWLEKAGYEVVRASGGREALSSLEGMRPDLILLDYVMPDLNGPEVLSLIRENESYQNIPVYYRTGAEDTEIAAEPAVDGVIPKSDGKPALMKAVVDVLH